MMVALTANFQGVGTGEEAEVGLDGEEGADSEMRAWRMWFLMDAGSVRGAQRQYCCGGGEGGGKSHTQ